MDDTTYDLAGHRVRRMGFGAMQLPGPGVFGPPRSRDDAIAVLRRAVEAGVNHIDTAQFYGPDVANELIFDALHPYPDDLVLVSKVGARRDAAGRGCRRSGPPSFEQACRPTSSRSGSSPCTSSTFVATPTRMSRLTTSSTRWSSCARKG
jgi:aryl-alcohol dehydrogenase-like predicted oxidoreductase